jgi:hypothetical protein
VHSVNLKFNHLYINDNRLAYIESSNVRSCQFDEIVKNRFDTNQHGRRGDGMFTH